MGLNVHGWPMDNMSNKLGSLFQLLDRHRPDLLVILESHLNDYSKLIIPHDDYEILLNNPSIGEDLAHSRGKGILIIGKRGLLLKKIFPQLNHECQAIALVEYENNK